MCKIDPDIYKPIHYNSTIIMNTTTPIQTDLVPNYLKTLNEKETKGYNIAKTHLGMSFQIEKSNGFLEWKKKQST